MKIGEEKSKGYSRAGRVWEGAEEEGGKASGTPTGLLQRAGRLRSRQGVEKQWPRVEK